MNGKRNSHVFILVLPSRNYQSDYDTFNFEAHNTKNILIATEIYLMNYSSRISYFYWASQWRLHNSDEQTSRLRQTNRNGGQLLSSIAFKPSVFQNHVFDTKTLPTVPLFLSEHAYVIWTSSASSNLHYILRLRALRYRATDYVSGLRNKSNNNNNDNKNYTGVWGEEAFPDKWRKVADVFSGCVDLETRRPSNTKWSYLMFRVISND